METDTGIENVILLFAWNGRVSIMAVPKNHHGPELKLPDYSRANPIFQATTPYRIPYRVFKRMTIDNGDCPIYLEEQ